MQLTAKMKKGESFFKIIRNNKYQLDYINNEQGDNDLIVEDLLEFIKINNIEDANKILISSPFTLSSWDLVTTLYGAIKDDVLKNLIDRKILNIDNINKEYYGNTLLMTKISNGEGEEAIELIEKFNSDPFINDASNRNSLHLLVAKGHKEKLNTGNIYRSNPDHDNQLPLFAKILEHPNIARHINDQDIDGNTALHIACIRRDIDYIKPLIEHGANLNIMNQKNKRTPLQILSMPAIHRETILSSILFSRAQEKLFIENGKIMEYDPSRKAMNPIIINNVEKNMTYYDKLKLHTQSNIPIASFDCSIFNQDSKQLLKEIHKLTPRSENFFWLRFDQCIGGGKGLYK